MPDAVPEGFDGLTRQNSARGIGDGARDHDGPALTPSFKDLLQGKDGGLGIQGVKEGLNEQQVDTTIEQGLGLISVGLYQFIKADVSSARVVDIW